jgi:Family of unknown function (DUF6069)
VASEGGPDAGRGGLARSVWAHGAVGAAIAAGLNVAVFLAAVAQDLPFRLNRSVDVFITAQAITFGYRSIHVWNVVVATVTPFLVGTALVWAAVRRDRAIATGIVVLGAVVALASVAVPFSLRRVPTSSIAVLVSMHVLTGAVFVAAMLPSVARRSSGEGARSPAGRVLTR